MKRLIAVLLTFTLMFALIGCASEEAATNTGGNDEYTADEYEEEYEDEEEYEPEYFEDEDGFIYDEDGNWIDPEDDMVYYEVDSSAIAQVSYSERTWTLDIEFWNSGWYRYTKISPELFNEFLVSDSLGGFYNDYIKGQYPCFELDE